MNSVNAIDWMTIVAVVKPIFKLVIICVVGHFFIVYIAKFMKRLLTKSNLDPSLTSFLVKTIKIALYVLVIISALGSIGVSTTGIIAAFSAAGLAVAVALKDSLSNVAGGILLLVAPRFATGDFIEVDGKSGIVTKVDLLHTLLKTPDNRMVSVPNGILINSHIINYSKEETRRVDITFQISYESDAEMAKRVILETIMENECILTSPNEPLVRVSGYKDSAVEIATRVWCKSADYWNVYFDLMEDVRVAFENNGIEIPYNKLDVHIKQK